MAVWLIRAGSHGEYEQKFIQDSRVYVTWETFNKSIAKFKSRAELITALDHAFPGEKPRKIANWASQIWPFAHEIKVGDLVVVPLRLRPGIQFGEVVSEYKFNAKAPDPYYHWHEVKWIGDPIPRANFAQDLLYSFGAFMTICRIQRNNAETRLAAMRKNGWKPESPAMQANATPADVEAGETSDTDLEALAGDQIAQLITARFKGHGLARLVDAILKAQGYTTAVSPEGPDGGVDILAGGGQLGFGSPRLCVEVKSGDTTVDRPAVDKLLGAVSKFGAQEGLFVSWSGFKSNVNKELAQSFFRVRLWSQKELLQALFATYDKLDDDIKAELPLKRIWTVATQEAD
jgi:restriction system protein